MEEHEQNEKQQLYDRISNIEKTLAKLSADSSDNTNKLDSLLLAINSFQSSKN